MSLCYGMKVCMSIGVNLKGRVACRHLTVSHVFGSTEIIGKGIEVHAWLCG